MRLDGTMDDGEPETAAAGLGREEGIEQPVADLDRDAVARVADAQRRRAMLEPRSRRDARGAPLRPRRALRRLRGEAWIALSSRLKTARCSRSSSPSTMNSSRSASQSDAHAVRTVVAARPRGAPPIGRGSRGRAVAVRVTRTRAKSRNSESRRLRRSDSRMTRRASVCSSGAGEGRAGELLDRAADRRERIPDLVRERRRQLRDSLEPLGAEAQDLHALLVRDVLEDRRRRAVGAQARRRRCRSSSRRSTSACPPRRSSPRRASCARGRAPSARALRPAPGATDRSPSSTGFPCIDSRSIASSCSAIGLAYSRRPPASIVRMPLRMLCRMSAASRRTRASSASVPALSSLTLRAQVGAAERHDGEHARAGARPRS